MSKFLITAGVVLPFSSLALADRCQEIRINYEGVTEYALTYQDNCNSFLADCGGLARRVD